MKYVPSVVVGAALVIGCAEPAVKKEAPAATPTAQAKAVTEKFGAPITETVDTDLEKVVANQSDFAGKTIRTTGTVKAVCQSAGCWMEIGDDQKRAHIKMANHGFFIPKTASGKRAVVQGTVQAGAPKNECGQRDSCGGEDNGAVAKVELVATGVEFVE